jgi:beta-1,4-mannosyl-glycoprotein beta-1,4-N-acetylglucosaminyltransferase
MRIFDSFPFDGELDLLEHRLRENFDRVDAFIIIESDRTYSGAPKELTFDRNRERFAWASEKIRHVKLQGGDAPRAPRERAAIQRDAVRLALRDAEPDDVILLLDADEIPSAEVLPSLRARGIDRPRRLLMTRHYEHVDALAPRSPCCPISELPFQAATPHLRPGAWDDLDERWWSRSGVAVPFRALSDANAFDLRYGEIDAPPIARAGRHYSSIDRGARLESKLARVFHTEWSGPRETSPHHLKRCREHGVHHRGWWYAEIPDGELPDDVKRLLKGNATKFPPMWRRRVVRSWAWMRLWRMFPDAAVAAIDRHLFLFALPLLAADFVRGVAGAALTRQAATTNPRPHISSAKA